MRSRWLVIALLCISLSACLPDSAPQNTPTPAPAATPSAARVATAAPAVTPNPSNTQPQSTFQPGADTEALAWLHENTVELKPSTGNPSYDEIAPLDAIVGHARILLFASPAYGAHELVSFQARSFGYLASRKGFTSLALQAPQSLVSQLNAYLQTGQVDPARILRDNPLGLWNSAELLDVLRWMRDWNVDAGHPDKLSIYGYDFLSPRLAYNSLRTYLQVIEGLGIDPNALDDFELRSSCIKGYFDQLLDYSSLPLFATVSCHDALQQIVASLQSHQAQYEARTSPANFTAALQNATLLLQAEDYAANMQTTAAFSIREGYLAANLAWIQTQAGPNAKLVVWSNIADADLSSTSPRLASLLRQKVAQQSRVIALAFADGEYYGSFAAGQQPIVQHSAPAPAGSVEDALLRAAPSRALLALRAVAQSSTIAKWFASGHLFRAFSPAYDDAAPATYFASANLAKAFDALVFIRSVTPSNLLVTPDRVTVPVAEQLRNLDLETGAANWQLIGSAQADYYFGIDHSQFHDGQSSAFLANKSPQPVDMASAVQRVSVQAYRGKRVRISGFIRTEQVEGGAGLVAYIPQVASDYMQGRPIAGTTDWTRYEIVLDVTVNGSGNPDPFLAFGIWLQGEGRIWIDDLKFEVVDKEVPLTLTQGYPAQPINLGFEDAMRGWQATGLRDYSISADPAVHRTGKASLMMQARTKPSRQPSAFLVQTVRLDAFKGKRIHLSGYVRTQGIDGSYGLWLTIQTSHNSLSKDAVNDLPQPPDRDWTRQDVLLETPPDADAIIYFGFYMQSSGTAWVDDIQLQAEAVGN